MSIWLLTSNPTYLSNAMNEMKQMDSFIEFQKPIELGVTVLISQKSEEEVQSYLEENPPIFIRHLHPVHSMVPVTEKTLPATLDSLQEESLKLLETLPHNASLGIQIRREENLKMMPPSSEIKTKLYSSIEHLSISNKKPEYALSIFLTSNTLYIGLSKTKYNLSDWAGGAIHLKLPTNAPSRSRLKLEEAFAVFSMESLDLMDAVDIGAAPGGWTSYLLDKGFHVTALDTGAMNERLLQHPNLTFLKQNAHHAKLQKDSFDLLTSDMSWSPHLTCKRIVDLAYSLRKGGRALVTIKLLNQKAMKTIRESLEILERSFHIIGCKQLFHNRDEVTVYLIKKNQR